MKGSSIDLAGERKSELSFPLFLLRAVGRSGNDRSDEGADDTGEADGDESGRHTVGRASVGVGRPVEEALRSARPPLTR